MSGEMGKMIEALKEWVSDPVVAALLGFFLTGMFLRFVSRFFKKPPK